MNALKAVKEHTVPVIIVIIVVAAVAGITFIGLKYARAQSNVDAYNSLVSAIDAWNKRTDALNDGSVKLTLKRDVNGVESTREGYVDLEDKSMWGSGVTKRDDGTPFAVKQVEYSCEFYDIFVPTDSSREHENCFRKTVIDGVDDGWYVSDIPEIAAGEILVNSFLVYDTKDYDLEAGWNDHWVRKGNTWTNTLPLKNSEISIVYTIDENTFNVRSTQKANDKTEPFSVVDYSREIVDDEFDFFEPEQYSEYSDSSVDDESLTAVP